MSAGVSLSIASSVIFGILYYLSTQLYPLSGTEIFGWRMPLTLPIMTAFMLVSGDWAHVKDIARRAKRRPLLILGLCLSSALLGIQQWLFLWAPVNGAGLSVSVGYFLLPLTLLVVGRALYQDQLSSLQWLAAAVASIGVAHDVYRFNGFSWETALVALGLPAYFALRRALETNNLGGLWFDTALMLPAAFAFVLTQGGFVVPLATAPRLYGLLPLLAALSAAGFVCYILASRLLPLALFGLLSYVEPVLLFLVALLIGETLRTGDLLTYGPIIVAVAILAVDGLRQLRVAS